MARYQPCVRFEFIYDYAIANPTARPTPFLAVIDDRDKSKHPHKPMTMKIHYPLVIVQFQSRLPMRHSVH
jgi:hypothetical protein